MEMLNGKFAQTRPQCEKNDAACAAVRLSEDGKKCLQSRKNEALFRTKKKNKKQA